MDLKIEPNLEEIRMHLPEMYYYPSPVRPRTVPAVTGTCFNCHETTRHALEAVIKADGVLVCRGCGVRRDPTREGLATMRRHWQHWLATGTTLGREYVETVDRLLATGKAVV